MKKLAHSAKMFSGWLSDLKAGMDDRAPEAQLRESGYGY